MPRIGGVPQALKRSLILGYYKNKLCGGSFASSPLSRKGCFFMNQQYSYIIVEIGNCRNKKSPEGMKANGGKRKENMNTI